MSLINWYPGHIAKAQNTLKEQLKLIDFVLELVDARLPLSSRFDVTNQLLGQKPRVLVMTKSDLADPERTQAWLHHYRSQGLTVVPVNAQTGQGLPGLQKALENAGEHVRQKMIARGRLPRASRVMVVGLPNVGKSSLINKLARKKAAKVGNMPGVTKGVRWIRLGKTIELMDTPGIIPPKLEDQELALKLAIIGSVSSESYDPILVVPEAIALLERFAPHTVEGLEPRTLEGFGRQRGFLRPGGEVDMERASRTFFHDIRTGALGIMSLDAPPLRPGEVEELPPDAELDPEVEVLADEA